MVFSEKKTNRILILVFFILLIIYSFIIKNQPNRYYGAYFFQLGEQCSKGCDLNTKLAFYNKAILYDPFHAKAYFQRGLIFEQKGEERKAFESFKKAADLKHSYPLMKKAGIYLFKQKKYDQALRYFLMIEGSPQFNIDQETNYCMGRIYEFKKNYKLARRHYAFARQPGFPLFVTLSMKIALIAMKSGKVLAALGEVNTLKSNHYNEEAKKLYDFINSGGIKNKEFIETYWNK